MMALCRIDSPNPAGMEADIRAIEADLRIRIARGELLAFSAQRGVCTTDRDGVRAADALFGAP